MESPALKYIQFL